MTEDTELEDLEHGTELIKRGFARMQKGEVIMDVVNREQARIAEDVENVFLKQRIANSFNQIKGKLLSEVVENRVGMW